MDTDRWVPRPMMGDGLLVIGHPSSAIRHRSTIYYLRQKFQQVLWTCKPFSELSATEIYTILHLRNEVFIVEQNCPYQDCDFKDLKAFHLMGTEEGKLLAYTRLLPQGYPYAEASIGRVVTSPMARQRGLGRVLMTESIRQVGEKYGSGAIRIGAQLYLKTFYESFGFVQQDDIYMEDNIPHIIMLKQPA